MCMTLDVLLTMYVYVLAYRERLKILTVGHVAISCIGHAD